MTGSREMLRLILTAVGFSLIVWGAALLGWSVQAWASVLRGAPMIDVLRSAVLPPCFLASGCLVLFLRDRLASKFICKREDLADFVDRGWNVSFCALVTHLTGLVVVTFSIADVAGSIRPFLVLNGFDKYRFRVYHDYADLGSACLSLLLGMYLMTGAHQFLKRFVYSWDDRGSGT